MGRVCLALVVLAACSGSHNSGPDAKHADGPPADTGPDPNDGARSGSRLKITYWAFADGTRQWNAFYDAQRKENCYIQTWADNNMYCTPTDAMGLVWSNATCTQLVGQVYNQPGCAAPPPAYIVDWQSTACSSTLGHLYARGAKLTQSSYYYKDPTTGVCGGPYATTNEDYYALGAEVLPAQLAQLTLGAPVGSGTLTERFVTSSDGLTFPWSVHDAALGSDCYPGAWIEGATSATCIPPSGYASYDHDAACTAPELSNPKTCSTPKWVEAYTQATCPAEAPPFYDLGATLPTTPLYFQNGAACTATTADPTQNYYGMATQLALTTLQRAPDMAPSHRIQLIHMTTPAGLRVRDYALYDQSLGVECYPVSLPDGTTTCLSFGANIQTYYTNATCTNAIDLATVQSGPSSCGPPPVPKYGSKYVPPPANSCAYSWEIHTIGTQYFSTVYQNVGTCQPVTLYQQKLYTVGATQNVASTFATASVVIDQ